MPDARVAGGLWRWRRHRCRRAGPARHWRRGRHGQRAHRECGPGREAVGCQRCGHQRHRGWTTGSCTGHPDQERRGCHGRDRAVRGGHRQPGQDRSGLGFEAHRNGEQYFWVGRGDRVVIGCQRRRRSHHRHCHGGRGYCHGRGQLLRQRLSRLAAHHADLGAGGNWEGDAASDCVGFGLRHYQRRGRCAAGRAAIPIASHRQLHKLLCCRQILTHGQRCDAIVGKGCGHVC